MPEGQPWEDFAPKRPGVPSGREAAPWLDFQAGGEDQQPSAFERFATSAGAALNPVPAIKAFLKRPSMADMLRASSIVRQARAAKRELTPDEEELVSRAMARTEEAGPDVLPFGAGPAIAAGQQGAAGDIAGAAGTVTGAYAVAPALGVGAVKGAGLAGRIATNPGVQQAAVKAGLSYLPRPIRNTGKLAATIYRAAKGEVPAAAPAAAPEAAATATAAEAPAFTPRALLEAGPRQMPAAPDTSFVRAEAPARTVVRDPKTGRMKRVYLSGEPAAQPPGAAQQFAEAMGGEPGKAVVIPFRQPEFAPVIYETAARAEKVGKLTSLLREYQIPYADARLMDEGQWGTLAQAAGVKAPSKLSISQTLFALKKLEKAK